MFERVPQAEQEQEERAFGPGTQSAGTGRRDEHQRVDFEAFQPQILDGLAQREPAAEQISDEIADERNPRRGRGQFFDRKSGCERSAANQRKNQFCIGSKEAAMGMLMLPFPMIVLGMIMSMRRSEENTSELQSLMSISYDVFCLKK